jgi:2-oxoglutarate dehydrogenase E1 component
MGFEYGYSVANPEALVLWEAQFGDFVNGAQIIVDQFISAAEDKWGQRSSLVLLLPHGFEGQGPGALQRPPGAVPDLAAEDNMQVAYPSTPAQYFHLLRRQALRANRKPLVVMTPKSLLRLPAARSTAEQLTAGQFSEVLPDPERPSPDGSGGSCSARQGLLRAGQAAPATGTSTQVADPPGRAAVPVPGPGPAGPAGRLPRRRAGPVGPGGAGEHGRLAVRAAQGRGGAGGAAGGGHPGRGRGPGRGSPTLHAQEQQELLDRAFAGL